jgi:hypothetical protein
MVFVGKKKNNLNAKFTWPELNLNRPVTDIVCWEICEQKLRSGVNWQGALKPKAVKQTGVKQGLHVASRTVVNSDTVLVCDCVLVTFSAFFSHLPSVVEIAIVLAALVLK